MAYFDIPTIDVSPFIISEENEEGKKKAIEQMREAVLTMVSSKLRITEFLWSC